MADSPLIERLRHDAQAAIDAVWEAARAAAEDARADAQRLCEEARREAEREMAVRIAARERAALADADRAARRVHTEANARMAERLFALAVASLPRFRDNGYPDLFARLARELPPLTYDEIHVAPADVDLARECFPGVPIVADTGIAGGLDARTRGDRIRIGNALALRLEAAWPSVLPGLMREVRELADGD